MRGLSAGNPSMLLLQRIWQKASTVFSFSYILSSHLLDHSFLVSLNTSLHLLPTEPLSLTYISVQPVQPVENKANPQLSSMGLRQHSGTSGPNLNSQ